MQSFLKNIINELQVSDEVMNHFKERIVVKHITKGQVLLRKDEISNKAYFVKSGCLRSYSIDEKGKEHIFMFAPEGWVIADLGAYNNSSIPAQLFIDAIEDSEVEIFDRSFISDAGLNSRAVNAEGINKLMKRLSVLQKRIILLMSATASERYLDFLETYPDIVQRVPQKMIASYLGITPEALSRIRGTRTDKNNGNGIS